MITMGCDQKIDQSNTQEQTQKSANPISDLTVDMGDAERGRKLYFQCRACHSLKKGEPHKVGPNLYGIFNAQAARDNGFIYSNVLLNSNLKWSFDNLNDWLEKPYELVPGNKMIFSGIRNKDDRDDLLAYLYKETSD